MSTKGALPTSPADIRSAIVTDATQQSPGLTANLPGSLIEDIVSTDVSAVVQIDQARIDAINSITPYGANAFVLQQMGAQFGIPQGVPTNTSVYVVFSGPAGYIIPAGFNVSDGTYNYIIQEGGVILTGGDTNPLYAVATQSGSWPVPINTVTQIITSVPSGYAITVKNQIAGVAGSAAETVQSYRSRIINAYSSAGQGTPTYIKTLLGKVPGVQPRLISVSAVSGGWEIICGGGDPYDVANAIYKGILDLSSIIGSTTTARNITVTVTDPPDTYTITFVSPPQQVVAVSCIWNTTNANFTGAASVNQLASVAIINYINSIGVGQPINTLEMTRAFQDAVSSALGHLYYLTALTFSVKIDGVTTLPSAGTDIIYGDSESYFYTTQTGVSVTQG
ncbi:MAG: hypothetical protein B7X71_10580 [Polynucleobacter sp. 39-46-10]|jgi:hypothetical protein|nr:MAG: hypothetical protein B7Y55_01060 [Polynucleobacter sp. 35-46-207]OZA75785.1 MAG: hypothetical protein B7X71_10580 [Polynucleobacter sp. 39-46-10]